LCSSKMLALCFCFEIHCLLKLTRTRKTSRNLYKCMLGVKLLKNICRNPVESTTFKYSICNNPCQVLI